MLKQVGRNCKLLLARQDANVGSTASLHRDLRCKEARAIHCLFIFNTARHPDVTRAHSADSRPLLYEEANTVG